MTHLKTVATGLAPKLAELTDWNDHSTAALTLAEHFGKPERRELRAIRDAHHARGHILDLEADTRRRLVNEILARVAEADEEAANTLRAAL